MSEVDYIEPSDRVLEILEARDAEALQQYLESLPPADTARALARLDEENQSRVFTLLDPEDAADLLEELSDVQGVDIVEDLPVSRAALIFGEMESDERADLLAEMDPEDAEAILARMSPEEAAEIRELLEYEPDTAGGVMITEFVSYPESMTVGEVLNDFRTNAEVYSDYRVQYAYVVSDAGRLIGVLVLRDLLLSSPSVPISKVMIPNPIAVPDDMEVEELVRLFDRYSFNALPVIDSDGKPVGVARRADAEEVQGELAERSFMQFSGIIGGQEVRSMPLTSRSANRLAWLAINLVLSTVAALVIVFFQATIDAIIALAALIPIISNMSGCSGNQALAVSIRELSLGLVRPSDYLVVVAKEAGVGIINGVVLAVLLGLFTYMWKQDVLLSVVIGFALGVNTVLSVILGGTIPLLMRKLDIDPAIAAAPMLTTTIDMLGFFIALGLATVVLL